MKIIRKTIGKIELRYPYVALRR